MSVFTGLVHLNCGGVQITTGIHILFYNDLRIIGVQSPKAILFFKIYSPNICNFRKRKFVC